MSKIHKNYNNQDVNEVRILIFILMLQLHYSKAKKAGLLRKINIDLLFEGEEFYWVGNWMLPGDLKLINNNRNEIKIIEVKAKIDSQGLKDNIRTDFDSYDKWFDFSIFSFENAEFLLQDGSELGKLDFLNYHNPKHKKHHKERIKIQLRSNNKGNEYSIVDFVEEIEDKYKQIFEEAFEKYNTYVTVFHKYLEEINSNLVGIKEVFYYDKDKIKKKTNMTHNEIINFIVDNKLYITTDLLTKDMVNWYNIDQVIKKVIGNENKNKRISNKIQLKIFEKLLEYYFDISKITEQSLIKILSDIELLSDKQIRDIVNGVKEND